MTHDEQADIHLRLQCASGHLNAVIEMTESNRPCEEVLHQLNAVEAALHAVGTRLIVCQAESIQAVILESSSAKERKTQLQRLQSLYLTVQKHSFHKSETLSS